MELMALIDMLEEVVDNSPKMLLSSKVLINKNQMFDLIKEIRIKLPDEIKKAEWVNDKKENIINEARIEAENMIKSAEEKFNELVRECEVTRVANENAQLIINSAREYAKELRLGAKEYVEIMLLETEKKLNDSLERLHSDMKQM